MPTPTGSLSFATAILALAASIVAQPAPAPAEQDPGTPSPTDVPSLTDVLERLQAAHAPLGEEGEVLPAPKADRFRARLVVSRISSRRQAGDQDPNIDIELQAEFARPAAGRGGYIRYLVEEKGETFERGRDSEGMWVSKDGNVFDLSEGDARTYASEEKAVLQNIRLADQLLRFLDPAAELRRLEQLRGPELGEVPLRKFAGRKHWVVTGISRSFPTYYQGGAGKASRLRIWIDAETYELSALEARPARLPDEGDDWGGEGEETTPESGAVLGAEGEFLLLKDLQRSEGLGPLVPRTLQIRKSLEGAPQRGGIEVQINRLELDPRDLTVESLRRPG